MHNCLRPLADLLTQLPAGLQDPQTRAGPSFEFYGDEALSSRPKAAWQLISARLISARDELRALAGDLGDTRFANVATGVDSALEFLKTDMPA